MIENAIKEYFHCESSLMTPEYEVKIKIMRTGKMIFGLMPFCEINALVLLRTSEIPFQEIAEEVARQIKASDALRFARKKRIIHKKLNWFVCSDKGGIYLYEALATKKNKAFGKMKNRFIIINTGNGTISLGPGHPKNGILSDTMWSLLERYRIMQSDSWLGEMFMVFDECLNAQVNFQ